MNDNNSLNDYREKLSHLSDEEKKDRDLHLKQLADGKIQGPPIGYMSLDKSWLKFYSEEAIKSELSKMTIYQYMKQNNKNNMEGNALNFFGLKTTYKKLFKKIDDTAKNLIELGVKSGDVVVINSVTLPQTVYLLYALNKIGAVANFTDLRSDSNSMKHYLNEGKSKFLFTLDACYKGIDPIIDETSVEKVVLLNPTDEVPAIGKMLNSSKEKKNMTKEEIEKSRNNKNEIKELLSSNNKITTWKEFTKLKKNDTNVVEKKYEPNSITAIVHTSGTTLLPKSVALTDDNFNSMALQYKAANLDYNSKQSFLNIIPIFVAYGAVNALHMPLCLGMTNILYPKVVGDDFPDIILKYKPNHVLAIPMHWEYFKKSSKIQGKCLDFLYTAGCGGDSMNSKNEQELNDFLKEHGSNSKIIKGYGMTEVSSCATSNFNDNNEVGSIGVPLVKNNIKVVDPQTHEEVKTGQIGEITIQSPTVMREYYNNPEGTATAIKEHTDNQKWLHSGDLAHFDNNGRLYYDGRMKRLIINRGFKVSAEAIEDIIKKHPAVDICAVVGISHPDNGQVPIASIVLKEQYKQESDRLLEDIRTMCTTNLPEYYIPFDYFALEKLPYTSNSKLDFKKLEILMQSKVEQLEKQKTR